MEQPRDSSDSTARGTERRIGSRHPLGFDVNFQPQAVHKKRRKFFRERTATVIDFSLTGLLLRSMADSHIEVGTHALIDAEGLHASVQVERIDPTDDPKTSLYGVQFLSLDSDFQRLINEAVGSPGSRSLDWRD
jgi:hypothetical protein